jgi:pilus assembly protein CpaB
MDLSAALRAWRALSAQLAVRRRLAVAVLTGIAVLGGLNALRPAPPATEGLWVAARDLPGGEPLTGDDVRVERLPPADLPADALRPNATVIGKLLAAPMRRGEPLTDVRLLSPSLLSATDEPDDVAVPVRVADGPATLALVHPGDVVDVIAAADPGDGGPSSSSKVVVRKVRVLATPAHSDGENGESDDNAGLLIVAASSRQANALAAAASGTRLSVVVRRQG